VIDTDKDPAHGEATAARKKERTIPSGVEHRQAKHLDNRLEGDHGQLERLIRPTLGFRSMRTARATITGFEVRRMFEKGQFRSWIGGRRRHRRALHRPPVRPPRLSRPRGQAITRPSPFFTTEPEQRLRRSGRDRVSHRP
jgi:hypothetical protein